MGVGFGTPIAEAPQAAGAPRSRLLAALSDHRIVFYAFFASRLALLVVGLMTQIFIEPYSSQSSTQRLTESAVLRMWGQWDSGWYVTLATTGYAHHPEPDGQVNWVFFPAFPMLSAGLARLAHAPIFTAMLALSNACFLAGLLLVHRLAREAFDKRAADLCVVLLCVVPGSYIFSSAYTESLFLAGVAGALLAMSRRRWLLAGAFAALAVLTRNMGMGLLLPFALFAAHSLWARRSEPPAALAPEATRMAAGLALPVLALAGFCLFLYQRAGDPFAFVTAQKAWGRGFEFPLLTPLRPLVAGSLPDGNVVNFAACWLSLALLAALALMRRWPLFVLGCFLALVPMGSGLISLGRYQLTNLPIFLAAAALLAPRPASATATVVAFATINGFMMVAWTLGLGLTI